MEARFVPRGTMEDLRHLFLWRTGVTRVPRTEAPFVRFRRLSRRTVLVRMEVVLTEEISSVSLEIPWNEESGLYKGMIRQRGRVGTALFGDCSTWNNP
jgi:hypothetical protein